VKIENNRREGERLLGKERLGKRHEGRQMEDGNWARLEMERKVCRSGISFMLPTWNPSPTTPLDQRLGARRRSTILHGAGDWRAYEREERW